MGFVELILRVDWRGSRKITKKTHKKNTYHCENVTHFLLSPSLSLSLSLSLTVSQCFRQTSLSPELFALSPLSSLSLACTGCVSEVAEEYTTLL